MHDLVRKLGCLMIGTKKVLHIVGQLAATIPGNISPFSVVSIIFVFLLDAL